MSTFIPNLKVACVSCCQLAQSSHKNANGACTKSNEAVKLNNKRARRASYDRHEHKLLDNNRIHATGNKLSLDP